ncbi:Uncharacterized protein APZ42_028820 [Daphnia magna]|uniref:Uncharacterized protein n=1 Tax=Daphnia magna TaxID=35525 RepID=A0A164Q5H9_9CRUS|nr:Uncharacterized protein APZ42_028820 [Daphnia magna]
MIFMNIFSIYFKVSRIMTDGGSNMVAAGFHQIPGWESGEVANESMPDEFTHIAPSQAEDRIKDRSSTASTEKPENDLSTVLKELTVPDLDTQEELEEVEHGIDLQLLSSPSVSFREVVEYCLTATYRATCTAHTLQLVVGDAMKAISGLGSHSALAAVEHASKIVNFVRKSNKAVGFHFVAKNATRWNSQLRMIAALLKAIDKDRKLQSKLNATKKWGELSHHELGMLKELTILLQPFEDATNDLQGDYETTGNVIP